MAQQDGRGLTKRQTKGVAVQSANWRRFDIPTAFAKFSLPSWLVIEVNDYGRFKTNFSLSKILDSLSVETVAGAARYFADDGNDGNAGTTSALPKLYIGTYLSGTASNKYALLKAGDQWYSGNGWSNANPGAYTTIIGPYDGKGGAWDDLNLGDPRWSSNQDGVGANLNTDRAGISSRIDPASITWVQHSGTCYKFTSPITDPNTGTSETPSYAIDEYQPDPGGYGLGTRLGVATSVANCIATDNTYILTGGVFYINVSRVPDSSVKVFTAEACCRFQATSGYLVVYNVDFEGIVSIDPATASTAQIFFYNCKFKYSTPGSNCINARNAVVLWLVNCDVRGAWNEGDGIDYDTGAHGVEINTYSAFHGSALTAAGAANTTSNASTCHDVGGVIRINSWYEFTYGRILHDANSAQGVILGCYTNHPRIAGTSATAHIGAGVAGANTVYLWVAYHRFGPARQTGTNYAWYKLDDSRIYALNCDPADLSTTAVGTCPLPFGNLGTDYYPATVNTDRVTSIDRVTASGSVQLARTGGILQLINPNGSDRNVLLWANPVDGDTVNIKHIGSANTLTLQNSAGVGITRTDGTTAVTLTTDQSVTLNYDATNTKWRAI